MSSTNCKVFKVTGFEFFRSRGSFEKGGGIDKIQKTVGKKIVPKEDIFVCSDCKMSLNFDALGNPFLSIDCKKSHRGL